MTAAVPAKPGEGDGARLVAVCGYVFGLQVLVGMDAVAKYLTESYPVWQVTWARFAFHLLLVLPFVLFRYGPVRLLRPAAPKLQFLRSLVMVTTTFLYFAAVSRIPLVDAIALIFIAPLLVTIAAPRVLGEQVGWRRWTAVVVGFMGVLVMLRPGFEAFSTGQFFALGCGFSLATYSLLTRKLAVGVPPLISVTYMAVVGMALMSLLMLFGGPTFWIAPAWIDLGWMVCVGLFGCIGHVFLIKAYEAAPASFLAPFAYSEIVGATALGYFVFGDLPDLWSWIGIAIVVGAGIFIALREGRARRA